MATIRKRGKRWQVQVRKGGVSASKSFTSKHEAAAWARQQEAYAGDGKFDTSGVTLAELIDAYKTGNRKKWGETKDMCLLRLRDRLGYINVGQINKRHLMDFAHARADEGAGGRTIADDLCFLGGVLKFGRAVLDYDIPVGVLSDAKLALKYEGLVTSRSNRRTRRISDEELQAIKEHWPSGTMRPEILDFALLTAMRLGEIVRIQPEDIGERTLVIYDRKHPTQKVGNTMTIPLLGDAPEMLARGLFPYRVHSVSEAFRKAAIRAGVEDVRTHDLRHECLSRLASKGWTPAQLMALSGHKSLESLSIYAHVTPEELHNLGA